MEKKMKLTTDERTKLQNFYAKCVENNVVFPSITPGTANNTIQELLHQRSITSLDRYADVLEKNINSVSRTEKRNGASEKTLPGSDITYRETVEVIDLIIKEKEYQNYVSTMTAKKESLKAKLEDLKTPEELRKEVQAELDSIEQL